MKIPCAPVEDVFEHCVGTLFEAMYLVGAQGLGTRCREAAKS